MELHQDDDDSDRTESYTPPPIDSTNNSSEKENHYDDSPMKQHSIILLDNSFEQVTNISIISSTAKQTNNQSVDHYWDQWPLVNDDESLKLYTIPDIDIPPSPPPPPHTISDHDILSSLPKPARGSTSQPRKPATKRKKKKKPMSDYRPPSPFSPKPDYKSMDIDQLKKQAMRYGLSTTQAKGRLIKILDEIYNVTHQYETDTDFELDSNDIDLSKKHLSHTPPTPAVIPEAKKAKKRQAVHQMSSSDEFDEPPPPAKKPTLISTADDEQSDDDDDDTDHEGRFLELTVYELSSSTASSSSLSIIGTPPTNDGHLSDSKKSSVEISSQSSATQKSTPQLTSESDAIISKKPIKKVKPQTPTIPLKEIVRNYIESNPFLHARVLCYEPIDFEEFHRQIKTDLNFKIASKELMHCLDDQCITFTLRSRKGAFTSVMRAKRRNK